MLPLAAHCAPGQPKLLLARPLVKITFLRRFKASGPLIDHLRNGADIFEVQTIAAHPVNPDVADHQHAEHALAFRFRPHQAGKNPVMFRVRLNNRHLSRRSLPFACLGFPPMGGTT